MQNLIARLKAATAPSRELDVAIECALKRAVYIVSVKPSRVPGMVVAQYSRGSTGTYNAPPYTSSLDTALSGIPEGWVRSVDATAPDLGIDVALFHDAAGHQQTGSHANECIATMIAVLQAHEIERLQAAVQQVSP